MSLLASPQPRNPAPIVDWIRISNRIFDLSPVVAANAEALGYRVLLKSGLGDADANPSHASWMVLTKDEAKADALEELPRKSFENAGELDGYWRGGSDYQGLLWTDDHSSILEAIAR